MIALFVVARWSEEVSESSAVGFLAEGAIARAGPEARDERRLRAQVENAGEADAS